MPRTKGIGFDGFGASLATGWFGRFGRSSRFPGKEKSGIEFGLMLVKTPVRFGVGIPGIEKTVVGMIDWRSSFVVDDGAKDVEAVVTIPPPEWRPCWAI